MLTGLYFQPQISTIKQGEVRPSSGTVTLISSV